MQVGLWLRESVPPAGQLRNQHAYLLLQFRLSFLRAELRARGPHELRAELHGVHDRAA